MRSIARRTKSLFQRIFRAPLTPAGLISVTSVAAFFYVIMEWLFIFTKPSFLKTLPFAEKLQVLLTSAGLLVLVGLMALTPFLLAWLLLNRRQRSRSIVALLSCLVPGALLAALALLLVDNFTYTVFHFGIVNTSGFVRGLYAFLFIVVGVLLLTRLIEFTGLLSVFLGRQKRVLRLVLLAVLLAGSAACAFIPVKSGALSSLRQKGSSVSVSREKQPDVLLITVDGVNAEYTSLYGGKKDTTPFLRQLADESLVAENDFSNGQGTIASITSILTGRAVTDTRVLNVTDMLQGEDAYRHLPGILADHGYYTAQFSNATYADAYKTNFLYAFDEANGRYAGQDPLEKTISTFYPGTTRIFIMEVIERISDRLGHIFFASDMANPYQQVTEAPQKFADAEKLDHVFDLLTNSRKPVFIHLHWLGTHGPKYFPDTQVFSAGMDLDEQGAYSRPIYLDAILEFDQAVKSMYQYLAENDRLDNTLVVITSDHSQMWTNSRIPLLIRFPDAQNAQTTGMIRQNVQSLDIAPTILDYLGYAQPVWMTGQSLLDESYTSGPIFTAKIPRSQKNKLTGKITYPESKPPFYQFGRISVVVCDQWFELDLNLLQMTEGKVSPYPETCTQDITKARALELIKAQLESYGFDTTTLKQVDTR